MPAATAYQRIGTRGRPEETGIDIKYLETLNTKHNDCHRQTPKQLF